MPRFRTHVYLSLVDLCWWCGTNYSSLNLQHYDFAMSDDRFDMSEGLKLC